MQTPMLSPDKRYIWDGREWLPIADVSGGEVAHRAIFPNWNPIAVEGAAAAASAPQVMTRPVAPAGPAAPVGPIVLPSTDQVIADSFDYRAKGIIPLWEKGAGAHFGQVPYILAGLAAIILVVIFFTQFAWQFGIQWPWSNNGSDTPTVTATPSLPLLTTRTEFARADRFYTSALTPGVNVLNQTFLLFRETCNGTLSLSCQDAAKSVQSQASLVAGTVGKQQIPTCIAAQVTHLQTDLTALTTALTAVQKAYADNSRPELQQAVGRVSGANAAVAADVKAIAQARQSQCVNTATGP